MKQYLVWLTLGAMALVTAGCMTQRFDLKPSTNVRLAHDDSQAFFVGGPGQAREIDAAQVCGGSDKIASVETEMTFLNGLGSFFTLGIYTPRQVRIRCTK